MKEKIVDRLEEAGVDTERFVDVVDGKKKCLDHDRVDPHAVSGNYGVYATDADGLVLIDVDDYKGLDDKSGLSALRKLQPTLEEQTPHGGTHRYYVVETTDDGRLPAAVFKDKFGKSNLKASWGEVRVSNQYVVAAGSQLNDCDKDGCDECATESGGTYEISADQPIATVTAEKMVEVLSKDPKISPEDVETGDSEKESSQMDYDDDDVLEYALEQSNDEKLQRLWRGDYSDYGGDRSEAESALAYKLAFWLQGDKSAVRRAMDKADTKKWSVRSDDSYRESVLEAVDECDEYFDPSNSGEEQNVPTYDPEEVKHGGNLLSSECSPTEPAGELTERNGHYGYLEKTKDGDGEWFYEFKPITNFILETVEHLKTDDSELLKIRVIPSHPMGEEYEVDVHPTVFNETRVFKEEIVRGKTTRYEPGSRNQQVLNDLRETVGSQMVPTRTGVEHIGLVGEGYNEWVSPKGTLTADGQADDPEHRYYAKGGSSDSDGGALARKWKLNPDTADDYEDDDVARIVELLPKTRRHDRGLPILGWFYAAPLRPLVHDWEGEFNLLQVVGSTGTGKTSTLKAFWEAFGMDPDPFSASDTPFTLMKHMSSSRGVPVWIDEYKPADIRNDRLDTLHRRLREVTKGTAVSKGRANLGEVLFQIEAPVVVSGEQKFSQSVPAVRRRAIMTTLSNEPTVEGSSYTRAFGELTGTAYEDEKGITYPEGYDLLDHARAYYQFVLSQDESVLEEIWNETRVDVGDLLASRDLKLQTTEFQGAQTILFGVRLFHRFAEYVGADISTLPTDDDVADALEHYASNIGKDGQRRGYDDTFLELFAQAARNRYVQEDEDYRFMKSQKWGEEVLAFHMPSVYPAVKQYIRDFNLADEYNIIGKNDYLSTFRDKSGDDSHILKTNHGVRIDGSETKCVVIDPSRTHQKLGTDFELRAFGAGGDNEEDGSNVPTQPDRIDIADIEPVKQDRATVVGEVEFGKYDGLNTDDDGKPDWTVSISDETGGARLIAWNESQIPPLYNDQGVFDADQIKVSGASTSEYEGELQLTIDDNTVIERADDVGLLDSMPEEEVETTQATTDGGETADETDEEDSFEGKPLAPHIMRYVMNADDDVAHADLVGHLLNGGAAQRQIEYWVGKCLERGDISEPEEGIYRR